MSPRCRVASIAPRRWGVRHRGRCLRCQAAVARARGTARELRRLRDRVVPAPPGLGAEVMERIGHQDALQPRRALVAQRVARHAAAAGVGTATAAAIATGVLRRRSRPAG